MCVTWRVHARKSAKRANNKFGPKLAIARLLAS